MTDTIQQTNWEFTTEAGFDPIEVEWPAVLRDDVETAIAELGFSRHSVAVGREDYFIVEIYTAANNRATTGHKYYVSFSIGGVVNEIFVPDLPDLIDLLDRLSVTTMAGQRQQWPNLS